MGLIVSVITVCFNNASTIRDTIESVIAQDYKKIEYIIVDGGSSDGTKDIITQYSDKIAKIISEPDRGIYDAMNKGIVSSTGDVIAFLNSDDIYVDTSVVRRLIEKMQQDRAETVFADLVQVDPNNTNRIIRYYSSKSFSPNRLRYGWMPAHPTLFVMRKVYDEWGFYSLKYQIAADFEMMVRIFHKGKISYTYLPEIVVRMRVGGISTRSFRNVWILNTEIVRACRENGLATNIVLILLKIPAKLYEYIHKPNTV